MARKTSGLSREFIIHPGETLKEILEDREMSQRELAIRTDVTETHVSNIVNCQKSISIAYAKKLEYALSIDASFWINLQANYDKELADFEEINKISCEELDILKRLSPISEYLKQKGFIEAEVYGPMLVVHIRRLLNVSSLIRIPEISQAGAYRLATAANVDPYILFTWLRMCDLMIEGQTIKHILDINKLERKIPLIKELMFDDVDNIQSVLQSHLAECGISFLLVKHFRGAPVQGVIKKNKDGTLSLIMTNRQKFADIFWFTLFHEIGHIINDDVKDKLLIDYEYTESTIEDRANEFASNVLIEAGKYDEFIMNGDFSLHSIKEFSSKQNIPPYILIGRLQRDKKIEYYQYSDEKIKYEIE